MPSVNVVALASSRNLRASAAVGACEDVVACDGLPHASAAAHVTATANPPIERMGHSFPVGGPVQAGAVDVSGRLPAISASSLHFQRQSTSSKPMARSHESCVSSASSLFEGSSSPGGTPRV